MVPNGVKVTFKGQTAHWILYALVTLFKASVGREGFSCAAKPASYIAVSLNVAKGVKGMTPTGFTGCVEVSSDLHRSIPFGRRKMLNIQTAHIYIFKTHYLHK